MAHFPHGTPSWIDLTVGDKSAAAEFYGRLFDWTAGEPAGPETGGYQMFLQGGAPVAGLMQARSDGQPAAWTTYISVDDADTTAAQVTAAGGQTMMPPMDVMDIGRMAVFADPTGGVFGVWQAKTFGGADLVNEPVSLCWTDTLTRDKDAAIAFYTSVFDWATSTPSFDSSGGYIVWERQDGRAVGGMMQMTDEWYPPEVPSHWSVCFAVADADAITARAAELGATVTMPLMDCPIGRFAGFVDPQGASFTVMALAPDRPVS